MTERELCEAAIEIRFAQWVGLLQPCLYHDRDYQETAYWIDCVLAYFDVPIFWREPVRVMAQGAGYYSADDWMHANGIWPVIR